MSCEAPEVRERATMGRVAAGVIALLMAACGGSPNSPAPVQQSVQVVTPTPTAPNQAPVIESLTVSAERTEAESDVTLTAIVKDDETPVEQLAFEWKAEGGANGGTFTGTGPSVKWHASRDAGTTPRDYSFTLTVTETYGTPDAQGTRPKHTVTASGGSIRVHDSQKELGDMSVNFLKAFADSSLSSSSCLRDFTDSCPGKRAEKNDIDDNRIKFQILSSNLSLKSVSVSSGQVSATMRVSCGFTSKRLKCQPEDGASCVVGKIESVAGDCIMTGRYEQKRWWLCDSNFDGVLLPGMRGFFGSR